MKKQKQCKRVTNKGIQCRRKALLGSEYCRIHQPREVWLPFFISIILSIIISSIITWIFSQKSFESELSLRHISRPRIIPAVGGFPVVIDDGIYVIINQPGFVTHKMEEGPFDYRIDEDGAIKIYGEIKRIDGTLIIEATGDHIRVLPNTDIDINSDSRACEIVDSEKNPIYQISVVPFDQWKKKTDEVALKIKNRLDLDKYNPIDRSVIETQIQEQDNGTNAKWDGLDALLSKANEVVELYYIHRKGDNWWCVTPEGSQLVYNRESMKEWQSKIPRLFKYPGKKFPGVRLDTKSQQITEK